MTEQPSSRANRYLSQEICELNCVIVVRTIHHATLPACPCLTSILFRRVVDFPERLAQGRTSRRCSNANAMNRALLVESTLFTSHAVLSSMIASDTRTVATETLTDRLSFQHLRVYKAVGNSRAFSVRHKV